MAKLKKSVKVIIISVVAVFSALAIVLGCVLGIKNNPNKPSLPADSEQKRLAAAINNNSAKREPIYEFDLGRLDGICEIEYFENFYDIGVSYTDKNEYTRQLSIYTNNEKTEWKDFFELAGIRAEGRDSYNIYEIKGNYVSFTYRYSYAGLIRVNGVAKINNDKSVTILDTFEAYINEFGIMEFDEVEGDSYYELYETYFAHITRIGYDHDEDTTYSIELFTFDMASGEEPIFKYSATKAELSGFEFSDKNFFLSQSNGKLIVGSILNGEVKTKTIDFALNSFLTSTYAGNGIFVEQRTPILNNSDLKATSVHDVNLNSYFNYNYFYYNFETEKLLDVSLDAGYAKATAKNVDNSNYFYLFEEKVYGQDSALQNQIILDEGKIVYFNSSLEKVLSYDATNILDQVIISNGEGFVTNIGIISDKGIKLFDFNKNENSYFYIEKSNLYDKFVVNCNGAYYIMNFNCEFVIDEPFLNIVVVGENYLVRCEDGSTFLLDAKSLNRKNLDNILTYDEENKMFLNLHSLMLNNNMYGYYFTRNNDDTFNVYNDKGLILENVLSADFSNGTNHGIITFSYLKDDDKIISAFIGQPFNWIDGNSLPENYWTNVNNKSNSYALNNDHSISSYANIPYTLKFSQITSYAIGTDGTITIRSVPTRQGFKFVSWYIYGMDSSTHIYDGSTSTANSLSGITATTFKNLRTTAGIVYFVAQWEAITINFNYDLDGGTSSTSLLSSYKYGNGNYYFELNSDGYYTSRNAGINNSYSLIQYHFKTTYDNQEVTFDVISYGEDNFDFGIFSELDKTLKRSNEIDTENVHKSFKGLSSPNIQKLYYTVPTAGSHSIYVKYIKDGSINSYNDSLSFKIVSENGVTFNGKSGDWLMEEISLSTPTKTGYTFKGWKRNYAYSNSSWGFTDNVGVNVDNGSSESWSSGYSTGLITTDAYYGSETTYTSNYPISIYAYSSNKAFKQRCSSYATTHTIPASTWYIRIEVNRNYLSFADRSKLKVYYSNTIRSFDNLSDEDGSYVSFDAFWTINSYRLTVDPNGGTYNGSTSSTSVTQEFNTTYTLSTPQRNYYTFSGWEITSGSGSLSDLKYTFGAGNGTVTAQWTPNEYTVSLYNEGNLYDTLTVTYNTSWSKTSVTVPTKTGYTFKGFYTGVGGTGTRVVSNSGAVMTSKTTITSNTSAYAYWTANSYSITISVPTSYMSSYVTSAKYDSTITISNPTRVGYIFAGWRITNMDSTTHTHGSVASTSTTLTGVKDTTFKNLRATSGTVRFQAQWTPVSYTITYNLNGGVSGGTQPTTVYYNNNNYGFLLNPNGYYESQNAYVNNSYSIMKAYIRTITANQVVTFKVINYAESNFDFVLFSELDCELSYSSTADTTNVYKSFKGLSSTGVQTLTYTVPTAGYYNIYIKFRKDSSQSTLNDSVQISCSGANSVSYTTCVNPKFTVSHPTRTGYTFAGWNVSGGTTYKKTTLTSFGNLRSSAGTVTFDAQWTPKNYTITMKNLGSTYGTITETYNTSWSPTSITIPTRAGYRFVGFYTGENGTGTQVVDGSGKVVGSPSLFLSNSNIYAHWIDSEAPNIQRATTVQDANRGYYIYAYVTDNVGVVKVAFPTWTVLNDQDDLMADWGNTALGTSGTWTVNGTTYNYRYYVDVSVHNNEYGPYINHLYAWDEAGNRLATSIGEFFFKFNVAIDSQGGTNSTTNFVLTYNSSYSIDSIPLPTKFGYDFAGVYTNVNGGGEKIIDENCNVVGRTTFTTSDTTIYIRWVPQYYNIEYLLNVDGASTVGTFPTGSTVISRIGYTQTFFVPSPVRAGYNFVGWVVTGMLDSITHYYYLNDIEYAFNSTSGRYVNENNINESVVITGSSFKDLHAINEQTVTLTAIWSRKSFNIHYYYLPENFNAAGDINSINIAGNMTETQMASIEYDRRFLILNASYNLDDIVGAYVPSELVQVGWSLFDTPQTSSYLVANSSGVPNNSNSFVEGTEVMFDFFKNEVGFAEGDIYAYAYYKPVEITIVYRVADSLDHMNDLSHYVDYVTTQPITAELGKGFTFISGFDKVVGFMISENNYTSGDMTGGVGNKTSVTVFEYEGVSYTALSGQTVVWGYPGSNSFNPRNPVYYLYAVYNPKG